MVVSISTKTEFIPDWNDNKKDENPIVVIHKTPTMALQERLIPKAKIKLLVTSEGKSEGGETEVVVDNRRLVEEMLIEIKNLSWVDEGGKEIPIKTAKDLFSATTPSNFSGLVDEIGMYFQKILSERLPSKN